MNRLKSIEEKGLKKDVPLFEIGDTVSVGILITEGDKERTQFFTGTVIRRKGEGIRETFTVRRIVQGEGVERVFPLHSPKITEIKVTRKGKVRRAKLYYLRDRTGKATKVEERIIRKKDKKKKEAEPAPPGPAEEG
jgi:large subunit ribosomal protein L19